mgnify:CR=1 FL=1|jgi:Tfp pilus assembly protein PilN
MIKLNIISPELKKEIKFKYFYTSLKSILLLLLVSMLIHSFFLLTAKYILQAHANETDNRSILITSQTENYDKKVKNINSQVDYINKIQDETITWSKFIEILSNNIDSGIYISKFNTNQKSNAFNILGVAKTRQDLLNFKKSLEDLELFADISIPIDVLLQKENISFSIETSFKSYEFK